MSFGAFVSMPSNSKTAGHSVKGVEIWDSGVLVYHIWGKRMQWDETALNLELGVVNCNMYMGYL